MTTSNFVKEDRRPRPRVAASSASRDERIVRIRPGELHRFRVGRYGDAAIPNEDIGLILIGAMLDTLAPAAGNERRMVNFLERHCRWMSPEDRQQAIQLAIRQPRRWTAGALGDALKLTRDERKKWGITTIRPAGFTDADMEAMRREDDAAQKKEIRIRKRLHSKPKMSKPFLRLEAIIQLLTISGRWTKVPDVCAELKRKKVIHCAGLDDATLRRAVHDAVGLGVTAMTIEKRIVSGRRPNISVSEIRLVRPS